MTTRYDDIIAKHFAGETSPEEASALNDWIEASPENKAYFLSMQQVWERVPNAPPLSRTPDTESALKAVKAKIKVNTSTPLRLVIKPYLAAAAVVGILITAWFLFDPNQIKESSFSATDFVLHDTLTDGSRIALNRKSGLTASFSGDKRQVNLRGEAHFDVAKDPGKPFLIAIQELKITVVGTSFNVDNLTDISRVTVSVEEGVVALKSGASSATLTGGMSAVYDRNSGQITVSKSPANPNIAAYRNRQFNFNGTPLSEVFPMLEKAYGVSIVLNNKSLGDCTIVTQYNNQSIETVLDLLAKTFSFTINAKPDHFEIDGGDCE